MKKGKSAIVMNIQENSETRIDSHRYSNEKGEISLIYPSWVSMDSYEIYCIRGSLFDDIERFDSLEDAENRIFKLLN